MPDVDRGDPPTYATVAFGGPVFVGSHCVLGFPKEETIRRHLTDLTPVSELAAPVRIDAGCIIGNPRRSTGEYTRRGGTLHLQALVAALEGDQLLSTPHLGDGSRWTVSFTVPTSIIVAADHTLDGFPSRPQQPGEVASRP